ncbi:aryl-sulfate sulfotransferase [candidate division KSB1 bacterium]|nr:aryl-sulfate sulfotransferase [candidate division KSB1 bacterium]
MKNLRIFIFIVSWECICCAGPFHPAIQYIFPRPGSRLLPREVTVIVRLEEEYRDKITDLQNFILVDDETGRCSGIIFYATDNKTIIFKPGQKFNYGEKIHVTVNNTQVALQDFEMEFTVVATEPQEPDRLLKSNSDKVCYPIPQNPGQARVINGVAVPSDFPFITVKHTGETAPGRIFYAVNYPLEGTGNYLIILNNDGTIYYYRKNYESVRNGNLTVHPTGVLTSFLFSPDYNMVLDRCFEQIDIIKAGHGYRTDNHELQILENGHILLIAEKDAPIDMSKVVDGGKPDAQVLGNHFQELDTDKNVIFEWRSWDFYPIEDAVYENLKANNIDYVHINSIAIDSDGHYVISARNFNEVTKINRDTGEIIWRLGGRYNQFTFTNEEVEFFYQHDARPVGEKPGNYLIFDNGRNRDPYYSRAVEYKLDNVQMTAEKVWEYRPHPDRLVPSMGSSQRLPNGNTLVDMPIEGEMLVREVTPDGDVVFELTSLGHSNYRCRRYEWSGNLERPYLFVENYGAVIRLIFNKFGDENVEFYKIYYGRNSETNTLLDTTSLTYLDCSAAMFSNMAEYSFSVSAVDKNGKESGRSDTIKAYIRYTAPGENLVKNGTFESMDDWIFDRNGAAHATGRIDEEHRFKISITKTTPQARDVRLKQKDIILLNGREYVFEFDAFAGNNRPISAKVEQLIPPYINYGRIGDSYVTTQSRHFKYNFVMQNPSTAEALVVFDCGQETGEVFIDNVSLKYLPSESDTSFSGVIRVNFQPEGEAVPTGYVADTGEEFGQRSNGYTYGWLNGTNPESIRRDGLSDARYATLNYLQKTEIDRVWEIELSDNSYRIFLVMGDAAYTDQINNVIIEDAVLHDPDGQDLFDEYAVDVVVNDGRLTLSPGPEAKNAKVCFVEIYKGETVVEKVKTNVPDLYSLQQNYPNPFNASTAIKYSLARPCAVRLDIYNLLGHHVKNLVDEPKDAGYFAVNWDGTNKAGQSVAAGIYFYRMELDGSHEMKKMVLVR